ncbi:MAG: LVIVD repeat-containing protein, partial [Cyclobacteriaceae bacterium]
MARFTIEGNYLYMLDAGSIHSVSIEALTNPVVKSKSMIAWDIETIFPHNGILFFGAQSGMYIYGLADPEKPNRISQYTHVRSCDPVVVEGDLAYVTLRSGTTCQGFTNQLEVINIKDLTNPVLLKIYPMTNPHGLGIDNKNLFVCDGDDGLKVYDATDHLKISDNQLAHYKNINTYDVIPYQNVAIMTGKDGIYQYDYSNPKDIKQLSRLTFSKE